MWSPKGQQVMIPTPGLLDKYYGIEVVNYHTGESVVQFHCRKRRREIARLLEALLGKHPTGIVYVACELRPETGSSSLSYQHLLTKSIKSV